MANGSGSMPDTCSGSYADAPKQYRADCPECGRSLVVVGRGTGTAWGRTRFPRHKPAERFCSSTAGYGDHVCCLAPGHEGKHECRQFRRDDGSLWAAWDDADGDPEPYACHHEEMELAALQVDDEYELWRCTRCGVVYRRIPDPDGPLVLSERVNGQWVNTRIRYEEVGA